LTTSSLRSCREKGANSIPGDTCLGEISQIQAYNIISTYSSPSDLAGGLFYYLPLFFLKVFALF